MSGRPAKAPLRVMFDSNAYDAILAHGDAEPLHALVDTGRIEIVTTHVQEDELRQIKDRSKRETLLALHFGLQKRRTPTSVALWGVSSWGQAKWSDDAGAEKLSAIQRNKLTPSRDELLGVTAKDHCDVVVTADKDFTRRLSAAAPHLQIMDYVSFREKILAKL